MKNKIEDLRNHLFACLERLNDEETTMTSDQLAREKAIAEVSQVLVNTVKMEVEYMKVSKKISESGFVPVGDDITKKVDGRGRPPMQLGDGI